VRLSETHFGEEGSLPTNLKTANTDTDSANPMIKSFKGDGKMPRDPPKLLGRHKWKHKSPTRVEDEVVRVTVA
jgi:hypothetical protein